MPFSAEDIRFDLMRAQHADGRIGCVVGVAVRGEALYPLGLHPDQPESQPMHPSPPAWWHAAAERT
ncbi:hypothetical protein [Nocardia sp. NPDC058658]|uniref:hypothetical protein n=1 Tax=unclassified Nocardia TaxID=2637762 RepID=UPI00364E14BE